MSKSIPGVQIESGPFIDWSLAAKLGSLCVHVEEAISAKGHPFDVEACRGLLADNELQAFLAHLRQKALLPVKR